MEVAWAGCVVGGNVGLALAVGAAPFLAGCPRSAATLPYKVHEFSVDPIPFR